MGAIGEGMDLEVESGKRFMFNLGDRVLKSGKEKAKVLMKLIIDKSKEGKLANRPIDDRFIISIDELKERGNMKKIDGTLREEMLKYLEPHCRKYHVQIALAINEQDGKNDCYIFFEGKDAATIDMCIESAIKDFERDEALKRDPNAQSKDSNLNEAPSKAVKANKDIGDKDIKAKTNKGFPWANKLKTVARRTRGFLDETNGSMIKALDKKTEIANSLSDLANETKEKVKKHEPLSR